MSLWVDSGFLPQSKKHAHTEGGYRCESECECFFLSLSALALQQIGNLCLVYTASHATVVGMVYSDCWMDKCRITKLLVHLRDGCWNKAAFKHCCSVLWDQRPLSTWKLKVKIQKVHVVKTKNKTCQSLYSNCLVANRDPGFICG